MDVVVQRFDVFLLTLDAVGSEIQKTRPCVIVSPDEINSTIRTVIVAPLTSTIRPYPTRLACRFQRKRGQVALDQIRAVDKTRLVRRLGSIESAVQPQILSVLQEMFAS